MLRINVLGLRVEQDRFLDQVEAALGSDWARANATAHQRRRR